MVFVRFVVIQVCRCHVLSNLVEIANSVSVLIISILGLSARN